MLSEHGIAPMGSAHYWSMQVAIKAIRTIVTGEEEYQVKKKVAFVRAQELF